MHKKPFNRRITHTVGYPCHPQLSRTSNSRLSAFITVKDLLAASGQTLVATNKAGVAFRSFDGCGEWAASSRWVT